MKNLLFTLALLISFVSFGQTADEYFNSGYDKAQANDDSGAISDYTKAIELNPDNADAYNNRGVSKNNLKDDSGAIDDYTKAIELNPNYAAAYNNRGVSKNDLKDYSGAINDYTKAIELEPNYIIAYNNRGVSKRYLKDYSGAIIDFTKAIELDPNDTTAYNNRSLAKYSLDDYSGAITDMKKYIDFEFSEDVYDAPCRPEYYLGLYNYENSFQYHPDKKSGNKEKFTEYILKARSFFESAITSQEINMKKNIIDDEGFIVDPVNYANCSSDNLANLYWHYAQSFSFADGVPELNGVPQENETLARNSLYQNVIIQDPYYLSAYESRVLINFTSNFNNEAASFANIEDLDKEISTSIWNYEDAVLLEKTDTTSSWSNVNPYKFSVYEDFKNYLYLKYSDELPPKLIKEIPSEFINSEINETSKTILNYDFEANDTKALIVRFIDETELVNHLGKEIRIKKGSYKVNYGKRKVKGTYVKIINFSIRINDENTAVVSSSRTQVTKFVFKCNGNCEDNPPINFL